MRTPRATLRRLESGAGGEKLARGRKLHMGRRQRERLGCPSIIVRDFDTVPGPNGLQKRYEFPSTLGRVGIAPRTSLAGGFDKTGRLS